MEFEVVPLEPITTLNAGDEYYFALQPVPRDAKYDPKDYALISAYFSDFGDNTWYESTGGYYPIETAEFLADPILETAFGPIYPIDTVVKIKVPASIEAYGFMLGSLGSVLRKYLSEEYVNDLWNYLDQAAPYQYLNSLWFPEESSIKITNNSPIILSKNNSSVQLNVNISVQPSGVNSSYYWQLPGYDGDDATITADGLLELTDLNKELDENVAFAAECICTPAGYPVYSKKQKYGEKFYWKSAVELVGAGFYDSIDVGFENV